jgi:hypothetical protein
VAAVRGARHGGGGLVAHGDREIEQGFAAPEIELGLRRLLCFAASLKRKRSGGGSKNAQSTFGPGSWLEPGPKTLWYRLVTPTGTKGLVFGRKLSRAESNPLVPVGVTNRY